MIDEISAAVLFLTRLIGKNENINPVQMEEFKTRLYTLLVQRFENHWFPDKPFKGQGYRCIRLNEMDRRDPVLEKAAHQCGLKYEDLQLPVELTIWVDPAEVCCRFGEHKGSYCTVASFKDSNKENYLDPSNLQEKPKVCQDAGKQEYVGPAKKLSKSSKSTFTTSKYGPHHNQSGVRGQPHYLRHPPLHPSNSYHHQFGATSPNCFFFHINVNSTNSSSTLRNANGVVPMISPSSSPYGKIPPHGHHHHAQRNQPLSTFVPRGTPGGITHHRPHYHHQPRSERYHWVNKSLIKA